MKVSMTTVSSLKLRVLEQDDREARGEHAREEANFAGSQVDVRSTDDSPSEKALAESGSISSRRSGKMSEECDALRCTTNLLIHRP